MDEIFARQVPDFATSGQVTAFTVTTNTGYELYFFDFRTEQARLFEDKRVNVFATSLFTTESGFMLAQLMGTQKVYFLDHQGAYQSTMTLLELEGWNQDLVLKNISGQGDVFWLTFETHEQDQVFLAKMFLSKKKITFVHSEPKHDSNRSYWYSVGSELLQITKQTGRVRLVSHKDFSTLNVLREGTDPVRRDPVRYKRIVRRTPYYSTLIPMNTVGNDLVLQFNKPNLNSREKYPDPLFKAMVYKDGVLVDMDRLLLGQYQGKRLWFDRSEQEFSLER